MICIDVTTHEEESFDAGRPAGRGRTIVPFAEGFVRWLREQGWVEADGQPGGDVVRLCPGAPMEAREVATLLATRMSKPKLKGQAPAWRIVEIE